MTHLLYFFHRARRRWMPPRPGGWEPAGTLPAPVARLRTPPALYSMPFFVHPYPSCDLAVMDRFVSADNPAKFPPITAGEFLDQRLKEIGLKK